MAPQPLRHRRAGRGAARGAERWCAAPGGGAGGGGGGGAARGRRGLRSSGGTMTDPAPPAAPEFARPVDVDRLPSGAGVYDLAATPAERAALARRFGLLALDRLEAQVRLTRLAGRLLPLSAALSAHLVQACVVTLRPVPGPLHDQFTSLYPPPPAAR